MMTSVPFDPVGSADARYSTAVGGAESIADTAAAKTPAPDTA